MSADENRIAELRSRVGMLSEAETAELLGMKARTLQLKRLKGQDVPPHQRVGRQVVYLTGDVRAWLKRRAKSP